MAVLDAHSRRQAALDAIRAVQNGALAGDMESEVVDFKEEHGTVDRTSARTSIGPRDERAAKALAEEAACLAMSENGGILVVGVNDRERGPAAFVGSYLELDWLRGRIYALTQPNMALDVFEEITVAGARIYLISVPPALEEVRVDGKLRTRFRTGCVELTGDRAREFLEQRRRYDWSAEASGLRLADAEADALARAHELYREAKGRRAGSDLDLAQRMRVVLDDDENPELSRAGALLLCSYEPPVERLDVRVVASETARSSRRLILHAPLALAFDEAWQLISDAFVESSVIVGATRRSIRAIPEEALREALVNAIMHRDYRMPKAAVIALCIGDPASVLKVTSPGGFPPAVDGDRLLAARPQARNPNLADAMRELGYGEREGYGIPAMFRVLLRDGHPAPDIYTEGSDVVCRLPGGEVDVAVRRFFDELYVADGDLREDTRAHIAITELLSHTPLRVDELAERAQCSRGEALDKLTQLAHMGAVERLLDRSYSFRLTRTARQSLSSRITYRRRQSLDDHADLVRAYLDSNESIGRAEASALLGISEGPASRTLSALFNTRGLIEPVGSARGRGVRYRLPQ
jgi:ATP-dependent DNA helicase RecG